MDRLKAATGTVIFLVLASGTVAGLLPWWITGWHPAPVPGWWLALRIVGGALVGVGAGPQPWGASRAATTSSR
jgi:hypothetical protein